MREETRDFINEHEELIDNFEIAELYKELERHQYRALILNELSDILISIGILPWYYDIEPSTIVVHDQKFTDTFVFKYDVGNSPHFYNCSFNKILVETDFDSNNYFSQIPFHDCKIKELEFSNECTFASELTSDCEINKLVLNPSITDIELCTFTDYIGKEIVIPNTVTAIHSQAFYNTHAETIVLPESIDMIPSRCFEFCSNLQNVTIPVNVDYIGKNAFRHTPALKELTYKGTMEQWKNIFIYRDAFEGSALEEIVCSDGILKFKKGK